MLYIFFSFFHDSLSPSLVRSPLKSFDSGVVVKQTNSGGGGGGCGEEKKIDLGPLNIWAFEYAAGQSRLSIDIRQQSRSI